MESSHLVKFSTSGKFITEFNVLRCISLSETLFSTGATGQRSNTNHLNYGPVHTGTISYRSTSVRSKKWYGEGLRSHGYEKKSSGPFQNRSRNWAVRKSEPEIGTIRYRTVPFSSEQKRYDIVPPFRTSLVSTGDTKLVSMTTSDVEVVIRPNCTSLILPTVSSFQNRPLTSTAYSY